MREKSWTCTMETHEYPIRNRASRTKGRQKIGALEKEMLIFTVLEASRTRVNQISHK